MASLLSHIAGQLRRVFLLTALSGLGCALLVHYAPGAQVDDRELNLRLNQQSIEAIRAERAAANHLGSALGKYLRQLVHGDLGFSTSKNAPVLELIQETAPTTAHEVLWGLAGSWLVALTLAIAAGQATNRALAKACDLSTGAAAGLVLSVPTALLAYLCLSEGARVEWVFVLALAPRIFRTSKSLLDESYSSMPVLMARALGFSEWRILTRVTLPRTAPALLALAATSVALGLGAAIPIETICDVAGLGRLAWQAALSRDLFLLVNLTMIIAITTTAAMGLSELLHPQTTGNIRTRVELAA